MKPIQLISPVDGSVYIERMPLSHDAAFAAVARARCAAGNADARGDARCTALKTARNSIFRSCRSINHARPFGDLLACRLNNLRAKPDHLFRPKGCAIVCDLLQYRHSDLDLSAKLRVAFD